MTSTFRLFNLLEVLLYLSLFSDQLSLEKESLMQTFSSRTIISLTVLVQIFPLEIASIFFFLLTSNPA